MAEREPEAPSAGDVAATEKYDFGPKSRRHGPALVRVIFWLSIAYTAFHLLVLNILNIDEWVFRLWHVTGGQIIAFLAYAVWRGEDDRGVPPWDWVLIAASVWCAYYIPSQFPDIIGRVGVVPTQMDWITGLIGTILVFEFARRTAGMILPVISGLFLAYAFVGPWMPGVLHHRGFDLSDVFSFLYSPDGIFGDTTKASSQFIVLFVVFASFLQFSKVGDYFMDLSFALFGRARGGPAKVTVISGILFGTISGSAVANVVASGTFTIPMMRKVGYSRDSAAAIEATSSTGGQITPPVMGAGAFIMAELTGIPYSEIALAAILPAILFYVANYAHVDIEAVKQNIRGLRGDELPALVPLLLNFALLVPMSILVLMLLSGYSVMAAGTWGIVASVLVCFINQVGRIHSSVMLIPFAVMWWMLSADYSPNQAGLVALGGGAAALIVLGTVLCGLDRVATALRGTGRDILSSLEDGAKQSMQLVAVCACAGVIVGILGLTGLGGRFSHLILSLAGAWQLLALLFAMGIALLLGMGMPTTAAYAIAAAVVAPGLQQIGVPPLIAHLFVFYFAVISAITPPVALASFAAAALAKSDPWKTSWESIRYGIAAFIVPFMFYYHPELLMQGSVTAIVIEATTAIIGILLIAFASEGWLRGDLTWIERIILGAGAFMLVGADGLIWDLGGIAIAIAIYAWRRFKVPQVKTS